MKPIPRPLLGILTAMLAAPAAAQDSGWDFAISPYLWASGIESTVDTQWGPIGVDLSASDIFSNLDFAFMGVFEARKDRWGLIADVFYVDLSASRDNPLGGAFSRARIGTKAKALSAYAAYRASDSEQFAVDLLAGFRVSELDIGVTLSPGALPGQRLAPNETWVDPVIGARVRYEIGGKWFATAFADIGTFGGDSDSTWQVFASIGYQLDERWSFQGGWRHFSAESEVDGVDVETEFDGPLLGLTFRF